MRRTTGSGAGSSFSLKFALRKPSPSGSPRPQRDCSGAPGIMLPACAPLPQPLREDRRKAGLHVGRDESGLVEIFEIGFVLCAKAGELHVDQVRQRDQPQSFDSPVETEFQRWLRM